MHIYLSFLGTKFSGIIVKKLGLSKIKHGGCSNLVERV